MTSQIVRHDVQSLLDGWLEAERGGEQFPVNFDAAWPMAGYARKDSAKRGLKGLKEGKDFSTSERKNGQRGRSSEIILLTVDGLKHLCLMADTPEGEAIRDYFIDAEKKWRLVQQHAPQVAEEIEIIKLKIELAKQEAIKAVAEEKVLSIRQYVTTALPEPIQQKILGYTEVTTIEYRDRVIHNDDVINDGSTVTKTELCRRYGILTKAGKPDYQKLNRIMEKLPEDAFTMSVSFREDSQLRRDRLPELDRLVEKSERNLYLGE